MLKQLKECYINLFKTVFTIDFLLLMISLYFIVHIVIAFTETYFNLIENLTKKLQGDRGERMKNKQKESASFLSIVQLFQEEQERGIMVKMAEMQKKVVRKEANELESMGEWKSRVLGVRKDDVI